MKITYYIYLTTYTISDFDLRYNALKFIAPCVHCDDAGNI